MIDMIAQYAHKVVEAATPWLVCATIGFLVLWLVMLCRRARPFAKEMERFSGLTPWHRFTVICAVSLFTLWGGSKERGHLPPGPVDGRASTVSRVVETVPLRTLPEGLSEATNALAITDFAVDRQSSELAFATIWASNLFDCADSRRLYLFSSTNLRDGAWAPLGAFTMPSGTNSHAFTVASNDVDAAMRPWFLNALAGVGFYRFGIDFDSDGDGLTDAHERYWTFTDPENADTDGDGLSDGAELSAAIGTNPLVSDTDGDGVGDGDEVAAGSNPHSSDTDGDGLSDAAEIGTMAALTGDAFLWFDLSGGTRLVASQTADGNSWKIPLPEGLVVNNTCHTNARIHVDGTVHLLCPTNPSSWAYACDYGTLGDSQYSACHVTVALCGADLYAKTNDWGSQILHGTAESGGRRYTVVEYRNVGLYECRETSETLTCQLILPHDEANTVYVSYLCASNTFREVDLRAGVQCGGMPSFKPGNAHYNLTWPLAAGFPEDGLTIKYVIGTGTDPTNSDTDGDGLSDFDEVLACRTDPLVADTDGDGLCDGEEVAADTDPLAADTDGDGMPDGWEVRQGLDPLTDDSDSDPDGDGLANLREYALGTSPASSDTDGDGLSDREEVGWWEYADSLSLPEFDMSGGTNLLSSTRSYSGGTFVVPLPFSFRCAGYVHTNITVGVCGMVGLMSDRNANSSFSVPSGNGDMESTRISSFHTAVAAYWDGLYAAADTDARITVADVEAEGLKYAVVQYSGIRLYAQRNNPTCVATFQVILPQSEANTVYVRYVSLYDGFDGSGATIGAQLPDRERTHQISYNTAGAITNGMVLAYHFGTGSDPTVADTDGDGLGDGLEAAIGTSARHADTDGDGMPDEWEHAYGLDPLSAAGNDGADGDPDCDFLTNLREMECGTDPSAADTDGDGLRDGGETGCIFATNAIPWLVFDVYEDITAEISTNSRRCVSRALPVPLRIQGEAVTNLTLSANGLVFLDKAGYVNPGYSTSSSDFKYPISEDALVLAPYLQYAHIRSDVADRQTSIRYGTATHDGGGYLLVEYLNSFYDTSSSRTNSISFQIAIPTNAPDRAYARYADVAGRYMDGRYASIGMQTFGGRWLHSWCHRTAGKVRDDLALMFLFGANSDPLNADTDGDGLSDGQETAIGTSPAKADTDGDGMPDGWEVQFGLDPLSIEGDDGADGDPDNDGLDNLNEHELGANPTLVDTDGDGLTDGEEAVCVSFASPLPWLEISPMAELTGAFTNTYDNCMSVGLPAPVTIQQETVTNITIDANGVVYFNKAGYANPGYSRGAYDLECSTIDTNCFTVAPYWSSLFLSQERGPSSVRLGTATVGTNGYHVLECLHLYSGHASYETNSISFQMSFPTGRVDRISVRYSGIVGECMDGRNASIGFQSFGAMESKSYCSWDRGMVRDGMGLSFVVGYGSNPANADTDGDGLADNVEVADFGSDPRLGDTDGDGLSDPEEIALGTSLRNPDSDGDGLLDGWEVANGLNPLSTAGDDGAEADIDGDGLTNLQEQTHGGNPRSADTDGDGLSDAREVQLGTGLSLSDTDRDGLSDGLEDSLGLNPLQPDSDGDGMNDGWEYEHRSSGFDPAVDNATDSDPGNDVGADPDGDGLTNGRECEWGTSPSNPDSDGDGVNDGEEVGQNSDPTDAGDEGKPDTRIPVPFCFGDPSGSHSEKYRLEVTPVSGVGTPPASFSWLNESYGECETRMAMLKAGWKYEVRLSHAGTNGSGSGYPDYDYELDCGGGSLPDNVIVNDPSSLFGTDYTSTGFAGAGKVATITVYAVTGVAICDPDDSSWAELDASRVVLDDEPLRIKVEVAPQIRSPAQCRQMFGDSVTVKTSGTRPAGVAVPIPDDAAIVSLSGKSEIRLTKTRQQLKAIGLLPSQDEDGVNEMAWIDIVQTAGQSLADSEAFATLGYAFRGKATCETSETLDATPPNSAPSVSYIKSAGAEILTVAYGNAISDKRQIMNQADVFYYSGHGNGATGGINSGFTPNLLGEYWKRDLNCAVIAGCSVMNIAGHRIKSFGMATRFKRWMRNQEDRSVGVLWENAANIIFLGYCYTAPLDSQGAVDIASDFATNVKGGKDFLQAWKEANDRNAGRNACAIDCTSIPHRFWYWDETSGRPVWTQVDKGTTSW